MPDLTFSRPGVTDGASDGSFAEDNELFLKTFGGEVMTAFEDTNVMADRHMQRTITSGKSAQFPATWKADASYHTPGTSVFGNNDSVIKSNERTINIDDALVSATFVSEIDELKNHYDVRSEYSEQLGVALAKSFDQNTMAVAILAARAAATVDGGFGGSAITDADSTTSGESLAASIFEAGQKFDEKDVPEMDRYAVVRPAQYNLLAQTTKVLNKDWGGSGVYADGTINRIDGIEIVKSNNLPNGTVSALAGAQNAYNGTFNTSCLVFQKKALGTVKLLDLSVSHTEKGGDFFTQYLGYLLTARYVMGHGILRPECAVEIKTA